MPRRVPLEIHTSLGPVTVPAEMYGHLAVAASFVLARRMVAPIRALEAGDEKLAGDYALRLKQVQDSKARNFEQLEKAREAYNKATEFKQDYMREMEKKIRDAELALREHEASKWKAEVAEVFQTGPQLCLIGDGPVHGGGEHLERPVVAGGGCPAHGLLVLDPRSDHERGHLRPRSERKAEGAPGLGGLVVQHLHRQHPAGQRAHGRGQRQHCRSDAGHPAEDRGDEQTAGGPQQTGDDEVLGRATEQGEVGQRRRWRAGSQPVSPAPPGALDGSAAAGQHRIHLAVESRQRRPHAPHDRHRPGPE